MYIMNLTKLNKIYFLGIGGIGMSALARYFMHRGVSVFGYDKTKTELTVLLESEGASITYIDTMDTIQVDVELVIYTPAIPKNSIQFNYFLDKKYEVLKRSEVLANITHNTFTIAVGGTHGKTSTSCMIAHLLEHSGVGCTAFLGGISVNFNSNFICTNTEVIVVEADEYDRSFHRLYPDIAVITSTDADHLDIYNTAKNVEEAFYTFAQNVKTKGTLIAHERTNLKQKTIAATHLSYAVNEHQADVYSTISNVGFRQYKFEHTSKSSNRTIDNITLNVSGIHNVENMTAAVEVAKIMGLTDDQIQQGVQTFTGIKRRFEYVIDNSNVVMIDDYAHHPSEITNFINSLRLQYKSASIVVIFQPHLFSRTNDFLEGFASSLSLADAVILLPIYPARELPIAGITSQLIFERLTCDSKYLVEKSQLLDLLATLHFDVVATVGAGDIDTLVLPIKNQLLQLESNIKTTHQ